MVFDNSLDNFSEIAKLNIGSAIRVKGIVVETPQAKQPYEVKATAVEIEEPQVMNIHCRKSGIPLSI